MKDRIAGQVRILVSNVVSVGLVACRMVCCSVLMSSVFYLVRPLASCVRFLGRRSVWNMPSGGFVRRDGSRLISWVVLVPVTIMPYRWLSMRFGTGLRVVSKCRSVLWMCVTLLVFSVCLGQCGVQLVVSSSVPCLCSGMLRYRVKVSSAVVLGCVWLALT